MPRMEIELRPVTHILTDAIGPPGKRVFYIQGWQGEKTITLSLKIPDSISCGWCRAVHCRDQRKNPDLPEASPDTMSQRCHIHPPLVRFFELERLD